MNQSTSMTFRFKPMANNCLAPRCEDCPLNELDGDGFTDQDRMDGLNSVILIRPLTDKPDTRYSEYETGRLELEARIQVGYKNPRVSQIAIKALEKQVYGQCQTAK